MSVVFWLLVYGLLIVFMAGPFIIVLILMPIISFLFVGAFLSGFILYDSDYVYRIPVDVVIKCVAIKEHVDYEDY